jgi:hypothetical protein
VLLVPPPAAPTDAQLEADPELQGLNWNNPYTRQYDPVTMIAVLSIRGTSPAARADVLNRGGTEDYDIDQVVRYGFSTPFAQVTARGSTPEEAVRTNELVVGALETSLEDLQAVEGPDARYYIQASTVLDADVTQVRTVSSTRLVFTILALGLFGVFAAVAVGDAVRTARGGRGARGARGAHGGGRRRFPGAQGRPDDQVSRPRSPEPSRP